MIVEKINEVEVVCEDKDICIEGLCVLNGKRRV